MGQTRRVFGLVAVSLAALGDVGVARAESPVAQALAALGGRDLVAWRPGAVLVAAQSAAPPEAVVGVLLDPPAWRRAVPAIVRAEVVGVPAGPRAQGERTVAWEVEIPLFNLKGQARLRPTPSGGADLEFTEGDFAPGRLLLEARAEGGGALVTLDARMNLRGANWLLRRMIKQTPLAEAAMLGAATWVVLRATLALAEHPRGAPPRPAGAADARAAASLDATALASPALAALRAGGVVGAVERAPGDRLRAVHVAVPTPLPQATLLARQCDPARWIAWPGWNPVTAATDGTLRGDTDLPFVDLDADWRREATSGCAATAVRGDIAGATFKLAAAPGEAGGALALHSHNPRLSQAGFVPRRFVKAEPWLEHALALALAYVDAVSLTRAVTAR